jgi:hypothetical protein
MEGGQGLVFRGKIKSYEAPAHSPKQLLVYFEWLCELNPIDAKSKWFLKPSLPKPFGPYFLTLDFARFDFKQPREGRKERIRMQIDNGEICWFFQPDDPSNLTQQATDEEFVPLYRPEPD